MSVSKHKMRELLKKDGKSDPSNNAKGLANSNENPKASAKKAAGKTKAGGKNSAKEAAKAEVAKPALKTSPESSQEDTSSTASGNSSKSVELKDSKDGAEKKDGVETKVRADRGKRASMVAVRSVTSIFEENDETAKQQLEKIREMSETARKLLAAAEVNRVELKRSADERTTRELAHQAELKTEIEKRQEELQAYEKKLREERLKRVAQDKALVQGLRKRLELMIKNTERRDNFAHLFSLLSGTGVLVLGGILSGGTFSVMVTSVLGAGSATITLTKASGQAAWDKYMEGCYCGCCACCSAKKGQVITLDAKGADKLLRKLQNKNNSANDQQSNTMGSAPKTSGNNAKPDVVLDINAGTKAASGLAASSSAASSATTGTNSQPAKSLDISGSSTASGTVGTTISQNAGASNSSVTQTSSKGSSLGRRTPSPVSNKMQGTVLSTAGSTAGSQNSSSLDNSSSALSVFGGSSSTISFSVDRSLTAQGGRLQSAGTHSTPEASPSHLQVEGNKSNSSQLQIRPSIPLDRPPTPSNPRSKMNPVTLKQVERREVGEAIEQALKEMGDLLQELNKILLESKSREEALTKELEDRYKEALEHEVTLKAEMKANADAAIAREKRLAQEAAEDLQSERKTSEEVTKRLQKLIRHTQERDKYSTGISLFAAAAWSAIGAGLVFGKHDGNTDDYGRYWLISSAAVAGFGKAIGLIIWKPVRNGFRCLTSCCRKGKNQVDEVLNAEELLDMMKTGDSAVTHFEKKTVAEQGSGASEASAVERKSQAERRGKAGKVERMLGMGSDVQADASVPKPMLNAFSQQRGNNAVTSTTSTAAITSTASATATAAGTAVNDQVQEFRRSSLDSSSPNHRQSAEPTGQPSQAATSTAKSTAAKYLSS